MSLIVAVDIGGTHIRAAVYEPDSITPLHHRRTRRMAVKPAYLIVWCKPSNPCGRLGKWMRSELPLRVRWTRIPGRFSTRRIFPNGKIFRSAPKLSEHFGVPVYLDNDANMAGLAEWQYGAGKGHNDLVYLTISTGIGGGVISSGHLFQGFRGMGAELGHMTIDANGPLCSCGYHGHVEAFSAGPAIARYVCEQIEAGQKSSLQSQPKLSAAQVAEAAASRRCACDCCIRACRILFGHRSCKLSRHFRPIHFDIWRWGLPSWRIIIQAI